VLVDEALPFSEVAQRIKEATEPTKDSKGSVLDIVYPVPGHPPMRPEPGFFKFVSPLLPCSFLFPESPFFDTCALIRLEVFNARWLLVPPPGVP